MYEAWTRRLTDCALLLIFAFLGVLCLPVLQMQFHFLPSPKTWRIANWLRNPQGIISHWPNLPKVGSGTLSDNFGFRPYLIRWNSILKLTSLGVSPVSSVILGKDSWLFYHSEALADGNTVNDFRGTIPLAQAELVRLRMRLEANQRASPGETSRIWWLIVPNKSTIYSEYLPDTIRKFRNTTRLDQLSSICAGIRRENPRPPGSPLQSQDRIPCLLENRFPLEQLWRLYRICGNHAAAVRLSSSTHRFAIEDGEVHIEPSPNGGDLAQMLFLQDVMGGGK